MLNGVLDSYSLKECVYKAMHPLICQHVGFQEAEITPHDNGTATVRLNLKSGAHERFAEIRAHWRRLNLSTNSSGDGNNYNHDEEYFLTSSSVTLKDACYIQQFQSRTTLT